MNQPNFHCDFCNRSFLKETTIEKHICESKRRWQDRNQLGNRVGFQCWLDFYVKNTFTKKQRTYLDFAKSAYYIAFVKFGNYCVDIKAINIPRYVDWLLENEIKVDAWTNDTNYNRFLIQYLKDEDPLDAIARSIENTIVLARDANIQTKDCLRYANRNRLIHCIMNGKISPWMLYHSESGLKLLEEIDESQQKIIIDYINPEAWAIKFKRFPEACDRVRKLLNEAGY